MKPVIRLFITGLLLVMAIKSNCQDRGINLIDTAGIRAAAELVGLNFTGEEIVQMGRNLWLIDLLKDPKHTRYA